MGLLLALLAQVEVKVSWLEINVDAPSGTSRRAIYWTGSTLAEITDALIGTGKKPVVVIADGTLKERSAAEGVPLIMVDGKIMSLNVGVETLLI